MVKKRRTQLHLSVRSAARLAGVSESLWRQLEQGHRPKAENIAAMSMALGWSSSQGLSRVMDGFKPAAMNQADQERFTETHAGSPRAAFPAPSLEGRVAALEDQLRGLMAVVLQIQHERQQDELRGSRVPGVATRSEL